MEMKVTGLRAKPPRVSDWQIPHWPKKESHETASQSLSLVVLSLVVLLGISLLVPGLYSDRISGYGGSKTEPGLILGVGQLSKRKQQPREELNQTKSIGTHPPL